MKTITTNIQCDRCHKVIFDSNRKTNLFGIGFKRSEQELGYVEVDIKTLDGIVTDTMHLCGDCWDVAVNALNKELT